MCAPSGNSEFCFPESLNVSRDDYVHDKQSEANNFQKTLKTRNTISDDKNLHFLPGASFVAR